mmetsp:Transcript_63376/g.176297  ORF Transcript_63376/g.176297 Transcript_63376/m.176297 type:complete len:332 (-) Transcript_63376:1053-2048(-)
MTARRTAPSCNASGETPGAAIAGPKRPRICTCSVFTSQSSPNACAPASTWRPSSVCKKVLLVIRTLPLPSMNDLRPPLSMYDIGVLARLELASKAPARSLDQKMQVASPACWTAVWTASTESGGVWGCAGDGSLGFSRNCSLSTSLSHLVCVYAPNMSHSSWVTEMSISIASSVSVTPNFSASFSTGNLMPQKSSNCLGAHEASESITAVHFSGGAFLKQTLSCGVVCASSTTDVKFAWWMAYTSRTNSSSDRQPRVGAHLPWLTNILLTTRARSEGLVVWPSMEHAYFDCHAEISRFLGSRITATPRLPFAIMRLALRPSILIALPCQIS